MFNSVPWGTLAIVLIGLFISVAAVCDLRTRRIPNGLTLPMLLCGVFFWLTFAVFHGAQFLISPMLGFLAGFGILFVLWRLGAVGGGDVKLMGALGIWLGLDLILSVFVVATLLIVLAGSLHLAVRVTARVMKWDRHRRLTNAGSSKTVSPRGIPYAGPVAVATWLVLLAQMIPADWLT